MTGQIVHRLRRTKDQASNAPSADELQRWRPRWEWTFAGILLLAVAGAMVDPAATWRERALGLGLAATLAGWYWLWIGRFPWQDADRNFRRVPPYLAGGIVLFLVLTQIHPAYMLLTFCVYWQLYGFLPLLWASVGAALFTVVLAGRNALAGGGLPAIDPGFFSILVTGLAISGLFARWIDALIHESTERKRLIADLEATRLELATVERTAGALDERQRLAHEIHDTLAQGFVSIVMSLEAANAALPDGAIPGQVHVDRARRVARENLAEARRMVWALSPEPLREASLPDAIRRVTDSWSETGGIRATVTVTGDPAPAHPDVEITLLRSVQEALANTRKHARASHVAVTLSYMEDAVALDVIDDGTGFDDDTPPPKDAQSGFGLRGMRRRAEALGGTLAVESEPAAGTAIAVSIPLTAVPAHSALTCAASDEASK